MPTSSLEIEARLVLAGMRCEEVKYEGGADAAGMSKSIMDKSWAEQNQVSEQ